jgi:SAM-dependent methyltransferase
MICLRGQRLGRRDLACATGQLAVEPRVGPLKGARWPSRMPPRRGYASSARAPANCARVGHRESITARLTLDIAPPARPAGLLGDTSARDYAAKLQLFNAFAEPELRAAVRSLRLSPGMRVLDAGCGSGESLAWLAEAVGPDGTAVGLDLAAAHVRVARSQAGSASLVVQADVVRPPFRAGTFDLVWSVNTVHHVREPLQAVSALLSLLRPEGRLVIGQSALLPELLFAWDSRLERLTHAAVREYYLQRYGIDERELAGARSVFGLLRRAGVRDVSVRTFLIERTSPLEAHDERYLVEAIFRDTWGERLRGHLSAEDFAQLASLCDPAASTFALRRPDFHFIQTFTLAIATAP